LDVGKHSLRVYAYDPYGNNKGSSITVNINCTGINDRSIELMTIYPNPVSDVICLKNIKVKSVAEIFNLSGQLMMICRVDEGDSEINIDELPQGIYTIRLSDSKEVRIAKLIKN